MSALQKAEPLKRENRPGVSGARHNQNRERERQRESVCVCSGIYSDCRQEDRERTKSVQTLSASPAFPRSCS